MFSKGNSIILIGWHNESQTLNGPANVFCNLCTYIDDLDEGIIQIVPTKYSFKKINAIKDILVYCFLKKNNIILVNENGFTFPFLVYLSSVINRSNKYFLLVHGLLVVEDNYRIKKYKKYYCLERFLMKNFPNIIVVSSFLKRKVSHLFNRNKASFVIYNGISVPKTYQYNDKKVNSDLKIIMTGGVKNIKGIFETLNIIKTINTSNLDYKCYLDVYGFIDDEYIMEKFNTFIEKNSLSQYIKYRGIVDKSTLFDAYYNSDLSISLSWFDTFNMSIIESMSVGTIPVVSSNCGASEIIDNYLNGLVVDMNGDYENDIIAFFNYIYSDENKFNDMRLRVLKDSKELDWKEIASKYIDILRN